MNTGIRDRDTVLESGLAFLRYLLGSFPQVRFDHHTDDRLVTLGDLITHICTNLWLVFVILERISMGTVDHDGQIDACFGQVLARGLDESSGVIWSIVAATKDDVCAIISGRPDDGSHSLSCQ